MSQMPFSKLITSLKRILLLGLCILLPSMWAGSIRSDAHGAIRTWDFGIMYYGARCALHRMDPYNPQAVLREFSADGGRFPSRTPGDKWARLIVTAIIYPPTAFLVVAPVAELPWREARTAWLGLISTLLVLAAFLMWDLSVEAPVVAGSMACYILLNCVMLEVSGNPVGVVAPFCVIASWCFLKERYAGLGVAMLAMGLLLKPHDAGFVWLYFLLAGGSMRRRALQSLAIVAAAGICAVIWIAPIAPHWAGELRSNLAALSVRGGPTDPGPLGASSRSFSPILGLQSMFSIFVDDPRVYNLAAYVVSGGLLLAWAYAAVHKRASQQTALLALATVSILTMLPVYHRADDAKLLLLTIPACAMLWAGGGVRQWLALGLTSAALFVTSAVPIIFEVGPAGKLSLDLSTLTGKLALLALQPAPLVLLAAGCFYLWVYIRYEPAAAGVYELEGAAENPAAEATL